MFYHLKTKWFVDAVHTIFVFIKLHEKGLVTKECMVTDLHFNFTFKLALHFTLARKLLTAVQKLI